MNVTRPLAERQPPSLHGHQNLQSPRILDRQTRWRLIFQFFSHTSDPKATPQDVTEITLPGKCVAIVFRLAETPPNTKMLSALQRYTPPFVRGKLSPAA